MARRLILVAAAALLGCAPQQLKPTGTLQQKPSAQLEAGVGDVVFRLDKTKPLPNAFGGADIFGRTTNVGFVEVRFMGVESTGESVFARKDVEVLSNESTMSRTPLAYSAGSAQTTVTGNSAGASARTTGQAVTMAPLPDYHVVVPSDSIAIRLPAGAPELLIEGHRIKVLAVSAGAVSYTITAPPPDAQ